MTGMTDAPTIPCPSCKTAGVVGMLVCDAIEKLADEVEHGGGFMWHGDEIHVGNEIVVGRDALKLLTALWHRASEREGDQDIAAAAYKQGFAAAKRQLVDAVTALNQVRPRRLLMEQFDRADIQDVIDRMRGPNPLGVTPTPAQLRDVAAWVEREFAGLYDRRAT